MDRGEIVGAINNVSQPPLLVPIMDKNGRMSKAWSNWFRDVYERIAFKKSNAIDDNKNAIDDNKGATDQELLDINASLDDTIIVVNDNTSDIAINIVDITANETAINDHENLETAHGSNGEIVGFSDLATELIVGLVSRMDLVANAADSAVSVDAADIASAPALYDQAYTDTVKTMANELKDDVNTLVTDVNLIVTQLNDLIAKSKTAGQMSIT